jgi:hypothetical protein
MLELSIHPTPLKKSKDIFHCIEHRTAILHLGVSDCSSYVSNSKYGIKINS